MLEDILYSFGVVLMFNVTGILPAVLGGFGLWKSIQLRRNGVRVNGEVIGQAQVGSYVRNSNKHIITYTPLVKFVLNDLEYMFFNTEHTAKPKYNKGDKVDVLVDPEYPNQAGLANTQLKAGFTNFGMLFFGLLVSLICIVFFQGQMLYAVIGSVLVIAAIVYFLRISKSDTPHDTKKPLTLKEIVEREQAIQYKSEDFFKLFLN